MEFDPHNHIVQLCLKGMDLEAKDQPEEALKIFLQAWNEATDDFEKFLAAHFVARRQREIREKLKWLESALQSALNVNRETVGSALPSLYLNIANCYEELNDAALAAEFRATGNALMEKLSDKGPFYHGTKADLNVGELLTPGAISNYDSKITMNHIYFTALVNGAGLAAALAKGEGRERVYIVEPTGNFENDPNVTDKKFPGNPTRSYRSTSPLKIVGEVNEWTRLTPEQFQKWREKLSNNKGEIIN